MRLPKIFDYPKRDGDRKLYVMTPVLITPENIKKATAEMRMTPKLDTWFPVEILLPRGYKFLPSGGSFDDFNDCKRACDQSNRINGFLAAESDTVFNRALEMPKAFMVIDNSGQQCLSDNTNHYLWGKVVHILVGPFPHRSVLHKRPSIRNFIIARCSSGLIHLIFHSKIKKDGPGY